MAIRTDTSQRVKEEELEVEDEPWEKIIAQNFKEYKIKGIDHKFDPHPSIQLFDTYLVDMPKGSNKMSDQQRENLQYIIKAFLLIKRDIVPLLVEDGYETDLMTITMILLQIVEDSPFLFEDYFQIMIEILACFTLKECSQQLILNSIPLRAQINLGLQRYLLTQTRYDPICEIIFTIMVSLLGHFDFINNPDYDLINLVITCFKFGQEQAAKTEKERQDQENARLHQKNNKRLLQSLENKPRPEDMFVQIPKEANELLVIGLALMPDSICQIPSRQKFNLHSELLREVNADIFRITLAIKILQSLIQEFHHGELISEGDLLHKLFELSKQHEYFTQPRECMKTLNLLLKGYDETALWIKFDSDNFFDNSNQNTLQIHGDPEKLKFEQGLFFDGCGAAFDIGSCLELNGKLAITSNQITISFWMVMFSTENSRNRSQLVDFRTRVLFCAEDGVTPVIFTDSYSQIFGVTNISTDKNHEPYGMKFFPQKDQTKTYSGWNHVALMIDDSDASVYLYLNGFMESKLNRVLLDYRNIRFICNSAILNQPFGYICDLRIYQKIISEADVKTLGHYDKHHQRLNHSSDIYGKMDELKLNELKRLLGDYIVRSSETTTEILDVIQKLCQCQTSNRLLCAKISLFEQIAMLVYHPNKQIQVHAAIAINAMR